MRRLTILVLLFFLCISNIKSTIADGIDLYSVYNGLPSSNVQCLYIDEEGFLWIGTNDGLSKFDGYKFHNHFASDNALTSLQNDDIVDIVEDKRNNLVFLTKNGIEFYDISKQIFIAKFQRHQHSITELIYHKYDSNIYYCDYSKIGLYGYTDNKIVQQLIVNSKLSANLTIKPIDDVIWIMFGKRLVRYHLNQSRGQLFSNLDLYMSSSGIRNLVSVDSNTIAIINDYHIEYINKHNFKRKKNIPLPAKLTVTSGKQLKTHQFSEQSILLYNSRYVSRFNSQTHSFEKIYTSGKSKINDVLVDNSNVIWVATDNGLLKIIPATQGFDFIAPINSGNVQQSWDYRLPNQKRIIQTRHWQLVDISSYKFGNIKNKTEITHLAPITNEKGIYFVALENKFTVCNNGTFIYLNHDQLRNRQINYIHYGPDSLVTLATSKGLVLSKLVTTQPLNLRIDKIIGDTLTFTKVIRRENRIYALELHSLVELSLSGDSITYNKIDDHVIDDCIINDIAVGQSYIWLATECGLYKKPLYEGIPKKVSVPVPSYSANAIITDLEDNIWASTTKGILNYDRIDEEVYCFSNADGVPNNRYNNRAALSFEDSTIVFGTAEGILMIDCKNVTRNMHHPSIKFIESIHYNRDVQQVTPIEDGDTITIQPQYKNARIIFSLLDYTAPNKNTYQYAISWRSKSGNWEHLYYQNYLVLDNYPAGLYHLKIKGHNNHGTVSKNITELYVVVKAPFWKSRIALGIYFIMLIMLIYLVVVARTRQLQKLNSEYREKERIAKKIQLQKEELTLKNKSITDSINYARRIQMAMMPSLKTFNHFFPDSFVLYLPKDIVSGDFYWINEVEDRIFFSAVDCTGHGVPGAFMSIIGFELFRRITETEKIQEPASILNHLSQNIRTLFSDEDSRLHDGMDLAFCSIDKNFKTLQFSGAFNPLYIIRNNSIIEHKGNRFSVGWNGTDDVDKEFINHTIPLQPGDVIYIFTDGYADQFGGPEGKKYKYRRFRHLLLALHQLSMDRQEEFLKKSILEWKGDLDQVDDILVIGIRVPSNEKMDKIK